MNRRGFLLAGAGLGLTAVSLPPPMLARMTGSVLAPAHTPDPGAWSDNQITLTWLGHATVLINFYGVRVLTDLCDGSLYRAGPALLDVDRLTERQRPKRRLREALRGARPLQCADRLVDPLRGQLKRAEVHRDAAPRLQLLVRAHRFL